MPESLAHLFVTKLNVKSALIFISLVLSISGIYMCFLELEATGAIDIKSAIFEGKINTGSLGLLVIFLSLPVAFASKKISLQEKHVEIVHGDLKVTAANMEENEWQNIVACVKEHEEQHTKREALSKNG